jgi:putative hydrolase of the HAD superfamily
VIRAVVFDLDDTLYPHERFVHGAYHAVSEIAACELGVDESAFFAAIWPLWLQHGSSYPHIFRLALEKFSLWTEAREWMLVDAYRLHRPLVLSPHDGVILGLKSLNRLNIKLGVLTNGQLEVQRHKFDVLGLAPLVDEFLCTGSLPRGMAKPHPAGFHEIARRLGVSCGDCVFVGDNPHPDFPEPLIFGAHLRVRQGETIAQETPLNATAEFSNFSEALEWIMNTLTKH